MILLHLTLKDLSQVIEDINTLSLQEVKDKYSLPEDGRDWLLELAVQDVKNQAEPKKLFQKIEKSPFNQFYTFYSGKTKGFLAYPRHEVFRNITYPNIGFSLMRQVVLANSPYSHFLVVNSLFTDRFFYSSRGTPYFFPLYIYPDSTNSQKNMLEEQRLSNFSQNLLNEIFARLGYIPTPKMIFYYIYAIFHSLTYRTRYAEFLKIDFPRVPLTSDESLFRQIAIYGGELVALHLMKSFKLNTFITQFDGGRVIDAGYPKYTNGQVTINKQGDGFTGVPEEVWNFYVGGYQVCQKWLKDRKGRTLSDEEIQHYQRIVVALKETIALMAAIDAAIPGFPIE